MWNKEWTQADDLIHAATMELREFLKRCRTGIIRIERQKDIRLAQDALTRLLDYRDLRDKEAGENE